MAMRRKRGRGWERGKNMGMNKRSSKVLYDSSWLDNPWKILEGNGQYNNEKLQKVGSRIFYDPSWMVDPWENLNGALYHESWIQDPWQTLEP